MKYKDEFSHTGFLPNRSFVWNISDSTEGALQALAELGKIIRRRRVSVQIIDSDYWLEVDKLNDPSPEWVEHLQARSIIN